MISFRYQGQGCLNSLGSLKYGGMTVTTISSRLAAHPAARRHFPPPPGIRRPKREYPAAKQTDGSTIHRSEARIEAQMLGPSPRRLFTIR